MGARAEGSQGRRVLCNTKSNCLCTDVMAACVVFMAYLVVSVLTTDPYLWLEEVSSREALEWVAERNASTVSAFEPDPRFDQFLQEAYAAAIDPERIPDATLNVKDVYDFWRDDAHPRCVASAHRLHSVFGDRGVHWLSVFW